MIHAAAKVLNNNLFTQKKKKDLKKISKINLKTQMGQEKPRSVEKTQDRVGSLVHGPRVCAFNPLSSTFML